MHLVGILADTLLHVSPIGLSMPTFRRPFGNPSAILRHNLCILLIANLLCFCIPDPGNVLIINSIGKQSAFDHDAESIIVGNIETGFNVYLKKPTLIGGLTISLFYIVFYYSFFFPCFGILVNNAAAPTSVVPAKIVPATVIPSRSVHSVAAIPPMIIRKANTKLITLTQIVPLRSLLANFTLFLLKSILASCSFSALAITQSTNSGFTA